MKSNFYYTPDLTTSANSGLMLYVLIGSKNKNNPFISVVEFNKFILFVENFRKHFS